MEQLIEQVTQALQTRLFIPMEASGRHVHLTEEAAQTLFGHGLTQKRPLSQPGQFLCCERVSLVTSAGRLENVAVLGPARKQCQVELSLTDCVALGIAAPIRLSGRTENTPGITLSAAGGHLVLQQGVIVAQRHLHMSTADAKARGLSDGDSVRLKTLTRRPVIFEDVPVRVSDAFCTYAHLDYDEANACGFRAGDLGLLV